MRLSVVIPTLNEAAYLSRSIAALRGRTAGSPVEVIVADCGSSDGTVAVAADCGARVVIGPELVSRGSACNAGAKAATGDTILFLHADSVVPPAYDESILGVLADASVAGGAFEFKLDGPQWRLRLVEWIDRLRYRIRSRFYGDQGIFVRRDAFEAVGGFPDQGVLEDAHFCARAKRVGRLRLLRAAMLTSPRRFYAGGILRTLAFDVLIVLTDLIWLDPQWWAGLYRRDNARRGSRPRKPGWARSPSMGCQVSVDSGSSSA